MIRRINPYCVFAQIHPHLPEDLQSHPEQYWLAKGRLGTFPPGIKMNGERSRAWYLKSQIVTYWVKHFGVVRPDCVQSLMDSDPGFKPGGQRP
jgi:hypothetical protein